MIFILKGGTVKQKNTVVNIIGQLADVPVFRRSVMNVPLLILKKSPDRKGQYISEIFKSYIGDTYAISVDSGIDKRIPNPGDDSSSNETNISRESIVKDVKTIAKSLTSGIDPLFLFNLVLKNVGKHNQRHHVFVDLQYKEELAKLSEKSDDDKILISLTEEENHHVTSKGFSDDLLPEIEELTFLKSDDLSNLKTIEISVDASQTKIMEVLVKEKLFIETTLTEEFEKKEHILPEPAEAHDVDLIADNG